MNTSVLLLLLAIMSVTLLTVKASPVHKGPVQSDISNVNTIITTTDRNPKRSNRYITTLQIYRQLVNAWQTIWIILKKHVRIYRSNVISYCIARIVKLYAYNYNNCFYYRRQQHLLNIVFLRILLIHQTLILL